MTTFSAVRPVLLLLVLASIWSSSFAVIKIGIETLPPITLAASRITLAAVVLYIYTLFILVSVYVYMCVYIYIYIYALEDLSLTATEEGDTVELYSFRMLSGSMVLRM